MDFAFHISYLNNLHMLRLHVPLEGINRNRAFALELISKIARPLCLARRQRTADIIAFTMKCTGRISFTTTFGFLTFLFCVQAYTTFTAGANLHHGTPIEIEYWDLKRKPINQMVDVTNELGIKVLAEHNYLNLNNIAFSPYGLMGILVALYEGVDGESSYQIQQSVLPRDRRITRIGFRDIHRALKTYFVPQEGFLAGLALNNENVTFSESYKKTLLFYGFELQNEPIPSTANATSNESTTLISPTANYTVTTVATTLQSSTKSNESIANDFAQSVTESTTNTESDTTNSATSTQISNITESLTTQTVTTTTSDLMSLTQTTTEISSSPPPTDSSSSPTTQIETSTEIRPTTVEISSPTTVEIASSTTETMPSITEDEATSTGTILSTPETDQTSSNNSMLETLQRRKKSLDFIFAYPPDVNDYEEYRSFTIGQEVTDDTEFIFNGKRRIEVPYMHYDSILDHAYLPHLEASALRLPLDSDRYYLLVVLPFRAGHGEIERLLTRMARESDLSDVYGALRPRHVRAKVPSFVVKGHVILTTDLQKLGIRDVFEPRQKDFTPLTSQPGVYVRSIEQAVSVSIRKYQPDETKKYISKRRRPIAFTATYPFLYFVMDSSIHVSLMAGKLIDPLNSRLL